MNNGDFIQYKVGEVISADKLKKNHQNDWQEAIENGYFVKIEKEKYQFTRKGYDFAWKE